MAHNETTFRLDDRQFAALLHLLSEMLAGDDPAKLAALTARLKASSDALATAVQNAQPAV